MPDCYQSTDPGAPNPSPRRRKASIATPTDLKLRSTVDGANQAPSSLATEPKVSLDSVQKEIREVVQALQRLDQRLADVGKHLPEPSDPFNALVEMYVGLECVRTDLLTDAIETLSTLASATEGQLQECFEERQKWFKASRV